ncbi:MAG: HEAT repeat domain-containing protein [Sphingobacteriales bacterium]|jgi:hypothetical protein|nr:MAG: HEAT repeat domain-containing protein [Sphingobacteriales bacterium]
MTIEQVFQDKTLKTKAKVSIIGDCLLKDDLNIETLLLFAEQQKATDKATCIEALEYATKKFPSIANESLQSFVINTLNDEEPRVKWESAKVIGNTAKLFPTKLDKAINNLLSNAEHKGTVVRWATAYALAEILKLNTEHNKTLLPKIEILLENEEDNGVKKKYIDALKKVKR